MLITQPTLNKPAIFGLFSAACFTGGFSVSNSSAQLLLHLSGVVLGVSAFLSYLDWGFYVGGIRLDQINRAKIAHLEALATALKPLTGTQLDLLKKYDEVGAVIYFWDRKKLEYLIRTREGDVPFSVFEEFLDLAEESFPFLPSIRKAKGIEARPHFTKLTNLFVESLWASPAAGRNAAKLLVPVAMIRNIYLDPEAILDETNG